jgi:hypothetical protein
VHAYKEAEAKKLRCMHIKKLRCMHIKKLRCMHIRNYNAWVRSK